MVGKKLFANKDDVLFRKFFGFLNPAENSVITHAWGSSTIFGEADKPSLSDIGLKCFIRKVFSQSFVSSTCVRFHAFKARNSRCNSRYLPVSFTAHTLVSHSFDEFTYRKSTRVARRTLGGKDMICSGTFIPKRNCSFFPKKKWAVISKPVQPPLLIFCLNFQVLSRVLITKPCGFFTIFTKTNFTIISPCSLSCFWLCFRKVCN